MIWQIINFWFKSTIRRSIYANQCTDKLCWKIKKHCCIFLLPYIDCFFLWSSCLRVTSILYNMQFMAMWCWNVTCHLISKANQHQTELSNIWMVYWIYSQYEDMAGCPFSGLMCRYRKLGKVSSTNWIFTIRHKHNIKIHKSINLIQVLFFHAF